MMYLKKKSIAIASLVLLIAIAFVINYSYQNGINKNASSKSNNLNTQSVDKSQASSSTSSNKQSEATTALSSGLFSSYRQDRDVNRSRSLEALQEIVNNKNTSQETRDEAQKQIIKLTETNQKELILENLIKAKGFQDAIVLIDNNTANVIVQADKLSEDEVAKIQDVVSQQTGFPLDNIKIMNRMN
ncbi:SpoIIIAH-like family protein [Thermoanaerobacterium thermosaccharolyticum]|uniref:Stage III sporulation protein AH n=3 Tax=Thermoanaerobacterium thermosaccharolyticum TaxID=1517 RepID=A0A223I337_THETR|nr:SpoIIIAH-like family protein [Thermoanaerobacterium thermosaccharolyticum]AST59142.1 stage III sporulation protein AH [Thermoanaerobacterium thermosaccharolyticum]MCP2239312.1 stage III sporulation protein AH [Thermoanaerobacterium thermosaccharolyticum]PHO06557.1 stage III sporulation protein AH [Thermoanaerobacterium thermosaccharolyticum]